MSAMDVLKECRLCFETTHQKQMRSPCGCRGSMAYNHFQCLADSLHHNLTDSCMVCSQKWIGIKVVLKRKNFFDYLKSDLNFANLLILSSILVLLLVPI